MSMLISLRRHIKSIKTTRKITYAMRLISMSLYAKLEKQNVHLAYYQKNTLSLLQSLSALNPEWQHPLCIAKDLLDSHPLYLIVASSKGLCGGFNTNLFRYFKQNYFKEEHQEPTFITIGERAAHFALEERLENCVLHFNQFNSNNFLAITNQIIEYLDAKGETFSSISIFSNTFHNFFNQKPQRSRITPLKIPANNQPASNLLFSEDEPILEQPIDEILDFLARVHLRNTILQALFQSLLAEQSARFIAMDHATTNADNFLERLNLKYNKLRQALITKELSELSASFGFFN